jgi:transposase InsO family protein
MRWPAATTTHWPRRSTVCTRPNCSTAAPWKTKESVELATLEWLSWFNHHRLLERIGHVPPGEFEDAYYRQLAESAPSA